jgi:hypothetical protein
LNLAYRTFLWSIFGPQEPNFLEALVENFDLRGGDFVSVDFFFPAEARPFGVSCLVLLRAVSLPLWTYRPPSNFQAVFQRQE